MDIAERHPGGRPTKFTPQVRAKLLEAITEGATYKLACKYANVGYSTFADWMQRGAAGNPEFIEFSDSVNAAEAEAGITALRAWRGHFEADFRAPRDFMITRFRDDGYGKENTVRFQHEGQIGVVHHTLPPPSSTDRVKLLALLSRPEPEPAEIIEAEYQEVNTPPAT
jgi:hypothetical protein